MTRKPRTVTGYFVVPPSRVEPAGWEPRVDIYRTRSGWLLKYELAGVLPEDLQVTIRGCRVTVAGVRKDWILEEEGWSQHSMEIAYNRFERSIELPCDLENPEIRLEGRHGILMLHVKTEEE